MKYVTINHTDLCVSRICMGTASFGTTKTKEDSYRMLDLFSEYGGNFIDTAILYANWLPGYEKSASEKTIGRWLNERNMYDRFVVATKGGAFDEKTKIPMLSRKELMEQIESSRQNLGQDKLSLYYLHRDDVNRPVEDIMDTLFDARRRGMISHLGCSNWTADRIVAANAYASACGEVGFVCVSNQWSLARINADLRPDKTIVVMDEPLLKLHKESNITAVPFTSTASGYLSKLSAGSPISERAVALYDNLYNRDLVKRMDALSEKTNLSVAQIAICWFFSHTFPVVPVTAFSKEQQLLDVVKACDRTLSQSDFDYLNQGELI